MASSSDLECKFNNSMSLEAADTLSEMSNSNSSETSDKKSKRKKEKREQPLYVPPNRRKSGDSSSADGCPPGHSPKSPSTDEVALPTRKNSTLLKTHENLSCCSKVLLSRLSDDSRNVEPSITRDKENSETDKKQQNGDDLLPRSVLLRRKEEQKSYISSPPGPSENEFDEGVVPNTSSPKKKDRHNGRLNGRLSYAERKEHTYEDIRTEVKEFFFDSHCHLDFIYKKYSCGGIDSWLKSEPGIMHEKFVGCIPNFIEPNLFVENLDPAQYDMDWILQQLQSKYVLGASYGCHPHYGDAFDDRILEKLQYLVENRRMSKLLAIGECGLDYMKSDVDSSVQIQVFSAQLALARKKDVPLVIHCRSGPRGPGDAEKMCLSAMEEAGLSRFHNIHRHCFTENWDTAQKWMESYDNVYFGFTSMIANWEQTSPEKYEVLKRLPLRRMLLETDAPYFRPRQYDSAKTNGCERFALPPMAVNVAFVIARAKGIDVNEVIRVTSQNVLQMYCIKKDIDDIVQR